MTHHLDHARYFSGDGFSDVHSFHGGGWGGFGSLFSKGLSAIAPIAKKAIHGGLAAGGKAVLGQLSQGNYNPMSIASHAGNAALDGAAKAAIAHVRGGGMTSRARKRRRPQV